MIKNQLGFTLMELIVAMAVFSFLLTIATMGFIALVKTQQKGVAERNAQQNARKVLEEMVRHVREASDLVTRCSPAQLHIYLEGTRVRYYAAGGRMYRLYTQDDSAGFCPNASTPSAEVITSPDVEVAQFVLRPRIPTAAGENKPSVGIDLTLATAGQPLVGGQCSPSASYCATSMVSTTASVRGAQ